MLETMRNQAQSWIAKVILLGIMLSFALWGVGDFFSDSNMDTVAEVDGKSISAQKFQNTYNQQLNNYRSMLGASFSKELADNLGLKENTLQTMINRQLMLDEAASQGLVGPTTTLLARIQATPAFQSAEGQFDASRYQALTRNLGFRTPVDYEHDQQLNLMVEALERTFTESTQITKDAIYQRFLEKEEKRDLTALIVETASLEKSIEMSDDDIQAYYDDNKSQFMSPVRLRLIAVDINAAKMLDLVEVKDDDVKAAYESSQDQWNSTEERRASHILVRLAPDAADDVKEAAQAKIEAVLARVKSGENFAVVAKEVSEDTTAAQGGDVGFFEKGRMVPTFEQAVFDLEKGATSDVVKTDYGLHVIQLTDIKAARQKTFDEVKEQVQVKLRMEKAGEASYEISRKLEDMLGQEDHLKDAVKDLDIALLDLGELSQQESMAQDLLRVDDEYRKQVFRSSVGDSIEVVEISSGRFVAVEVLERLDPQEQALADVKEQVTTFAKQEKVKVAVREQATALLAKHQGDLSSLAKASDAQVLYTAKAVKLDGTGDEKSGWLKNDLLDQAFLLEEGQVAAQVFETEKGFALVQVDRILTASDDDFALMRDDLETELRKSGGQSRFERWMSSVRQHHDIQVNKSILLKF
ncbi:MAG: SurA N-terminal domain-containing protein [Mariprofundaceae bacterium]|nr:SurA N-terminal domain-containing protein [Mariprofundaceae bacterium]